MTRALTDEQERAVAARSGSRLLSAAAGSGKTTVLVERFVRAVAEDGLDPGRILAITFTERAAGELRARVRSRLAELGLDHAARDTEGAAIGTIHGFCARVLRAHPLAAGVDPEMRVLDAPTAERLRRAALRPALAELLRGGGEPALELVAAFGPDRLRTAILELHTELRSRGQRHPRLPEAPAPTGLGVDTAVRELAAVAAEAIVELRAARAGGGCSEAAGARIDAALELLGAVAADPGAADPARHSLAGNGGTALSGIACARYREALAALGQARADERALAALPHLDALVRGHSRAYEELKRARGAVDFDDLELGALELLAGDRALAVAWAERFALIMVDEFQDTNPRQLALLELIERDNLLTVGDAEQSIYGFRHADVGIFRRRRAVLAARGAHGTLTHNFRSREPVLELVNRVFAARLGEDHTPLVRGRPEDGGAAVELLLTDRDEGWDELDWLGAGLPPAPAWRQAEARLLAQRVAELVRAGETVPGEVAVLVRAAGDLAVFERALEQQGLPTLAAGGRGYWSDQQVQDLLGLLRVLANPLDEPALYGVLAGPLVGVGSDTLALLGAAALAGGRPPWQVLLDPEAPAGVAADDRERLAEARAWLTGERERAPLRSLEERIACAVRDRGYDAYVLSLEGGARRLANIHKLQRLARRYEQSDGRDLRGFLDHVAVAAEAPTGEPDAPAGDDGAGAVRLMTVHGAKGLEFGTVCVADLGRRGRNQVPDLLVDADGAVGLNLPRLDAAAPQGALAWAALRERRLAAEAAEEQRILYVAMTRARERLLLSGAVDLGDWPAPKPGAPMLSWLGPAVLESPPASLRAGEIPRREGGLLVWASTPARVGEVLRPVLAPEPAPRGEAPEPGIARAPAAPVPGPAATDPPGPARAVSYSALAAHERCGYRYYLERVLALPELCEPRAGGSGGLDPRQYGRLAHLALERVDFDRLRAPTPAELEGLAADHGLRPAAGELDTLATRIAALAGSALAERLARSARTRREHPFAFSLGPHRPLVVGVIDVLAHELDGGCLIVDYKADRLDPGAALGAGAARDYELQRHVYALAALRDGARSVAVAHWYLERPEEPVILAFAPADAEPIAADLCRRLDALEAGGFAVAASPDRVLCSGCPGRGGLCSWPEEVTRRTPGGAPEGSEAAVRP